jgi:alpha-tubulin suppressor-like RCC1 family protein
MILFYFAGHVTDLKDVAVMSITLGKAHAVALTNDGQIYTFGLNNKGQCGRDVSPGASKEGRYMYKGDLSRFELVSHLYQVLSLPGTP